MFALKEKILKYFNKKRSIIAGVLLVLFLVFWFSLPSPLFKTPTSTVIEDINGNLLGAKIAGDGQWRFANNNKVPEKFEKSIIYFEDEYFYYHLGFNPISFGRAIIQNIKSRKIESGGSTLSMQVIRLSRNGKSRTIFEKIVEVILATRMELTYSKKEILALYASNAPFGGNVVGLDAASWRYFGRNPDKLSWAESATLAVLPNAPSLIFPGKNQKKLLLKRNRLLDKLNKEKVIDDATCELAKSEPLPGKPYPLPHFAPHLIDLAIKDGYSGQRTKTTINFDLQNRINEIVEAHHQ
ncbi:MAG: transglycosylase domain-containing protein, partial [Bacteroidetes bacterium]|nr:transglycosylase domain-containing protein [Bacteroidota bacterium]